MTVGLAQQGVKVKPFTLFYCLLHFFTNTFVTLVNDFK
jgi:hypothetical protein